MVTPILEGIAASSGKTVASAVIAEIMAMGECFALGSAAKWAVRNFTSADSYAGI